MGSAPSGFGAVHRQIGILQQFFNADAILRGESNTDAGVGSHQMAKTFIGLSDRLIDTTGKGRDIFRTFNNRLNYSKFITAQSCNDIRFIETVLQAPRHRFQQFIADPMTEQVVDTLEFVNVDVEQSQLLAIYQSRERRFKLLLKEHSIRKIC